MAVNCFKSDACWPLPILVAHNMCSACGNMCEDVWSIKGGVFGADMACFSPEWAISQYDFLCKLSVPSPKLQYFSCVACSPSFKSGCQFCFQHFCLWLINPFSPGCLLSLCSRHMVSGMFWRLSHNTYRIVSIAVHLVSPPMMISYCEVPGNSKRYWTGVLPKSVALSIVGCLGWRGR